MISDIKHGHAFKLSGRFEIKAMKDYHYLYFKCDILLLNGVFQKCRNSSLKNYELFESHYLSAPVLS